MTTEFEINQESVATTGTDLRVLAAQRFAEKGYPDPSNEEYKYLNLAKSLESIPTKLESDKNSNSELPLTIDSYKLVFNNGKLDLNRSDFGNSEEGLSIQNFSWKEFSSISNANKWGKLADISDSFVSENTSEMEEINLVSVKAGVVLTKPVYIYQLFSGNTSGKSFARILLEFGANSGAEIYNHVVSSELNSAIFLNSVTEIFLEENAGINYFQIQEQGKNIQSVNYLVAELKANSRFNHHNFCLSGNVIRNNTQLIMNGKGAEGSLFGIFLPGTDEVFDNHTLVDHQVAHCPSNELYKGIALGKGTGIFNGKIFVRKDAQKTNAFQSNKNLLLSDDAVIYTMPQLEIYADDVKCSHGSSTGQLDEKALFYLQSRGIGIESAKRLLVTAFAGEVLNEVKNETVYSYLENAIEQKLILA